MAQRTFVDPIKYTVGKDISEEQYAEALLKITDWFAQSRRTEEPAAMARMALQECLEGKKSDGTPWFSMALSSLTKRVRSKCLFDIESMQPLMKASDKRKARKVRERQRNMEKRRAADSFIPEELIEEQKRIDGKATINYGDDPRTLLSSEELRNWQKYKRDYQKQHPELTVASADAELNQLCDLHILADRYRLRLLAGQKVDPNERARAGEELLRLKRSLGILPEQIEKRAKPKTETTIGAAADKLESMGNWRELRARYWAEEMIQIFQMYHTPTADGQSYQLDEVGLFGLTKCRTCQCAGCGMRNYVGIDITEIQQYLEAQGWIRPVPHADA